MQSSNELLREVDGWVAGLIDLHTRLARHFVRAEPRQQVLAYLKGLLSPIERKNGWQIAEWTGAATPDKIHRLLATAKWNADLVRDDLQQYVLEHFQDSQAILVVDETGIPKRGQKSVGVQNQYCGVTGQVENCQVAVFVSYVGSQGFTFFDRELYLPRSWTEDPVRRKEAGIPNTVNFATKGELAQRMLERVLTKGVPFAWITADSLYGSDQGLRTWLEERSLPYVLAVRSDEPIVVRTAQGICSVSVKDVAGEFSDERWQRLSMGAGSKGPREFDWACLPIQHRGVEDQQHWVLLRRRLSDPTDLTSYLVYGPSGTSLQEMVSVVGARWKIEEIFQTAKGELGLDQYEVRLWTCWYRHVTLTMFAHAYLTMVRAQVSCPADNSALETAEALLPFTIPEIRRVLWQVLWPFHPPLEQILAWSRWRRRHQISARSAHCKRRMKRQAVQRARESARLVPQFQEDGRCHPDAAASEKLLRKRGAHLLTLIEYVAEDRYLLISEQAEERPIQVGSCEWFAKREQLVSFRFQGKQGRFTARLEKRHQKDWYWMAYRKFQNKLYQQYIGPQAMLSPERLEQIAATLLMRIEGG